MNALHDENGRPTMIGVSSVDGKTITQVYSDPLNNTIKVSDGVGGVDLGNNQGNALVDDNGVAVLMAESSAGDGSLVELYVDATGSLLVKST